VTATAITLRRHQEADERVGHLFKALHTFADRTIVRFFSDCREMQTVMPVLSFDELRNDRRGVYRAKDGYTLAHSITLNPYALRDGEEAAEVLAHELVHVWENVTGNQQSENYHGAQFHERMMRYGIETAGRHGRTVRHVTVDGEPVWANWLAENEDLQLGKFILDGYAKEARRRMLKWGCPACGFSFRTRRNDVNAICMMQDCAEPFERMDETGDDDG
jgi:hypothetical protein